MVLTSNDWSKIDCHVKRDLGNRLILPGDAAFSVFYTTKTNEVNHLMRCVSVLEVELAGEGPASNGDTLSSFPAERIGQNVLCFLKLVSFEYNFTVSVSVCHKLEVVVIFSE